MTAPRSFDLARLLSTVFAPKKGEKICILIDLENPSEVKNFQFLKNPALTIQKHAYNDFYLALKNGVLKQLGLEENNFFAYKITGGSNLDLPTAAYDVEGNEVSFEKDIYPKYNIILCISTFSATAPLTAFAKKYGFCGATLHGVNDIILQSGLSVDYNEVSVQAEKFRKGLTKADFIEIDFEVFGENHTLKIDLDRQEAQKSHGLCRGERPDVANLPAGEVYFVPTSATGEFPMRYEDGTLGLMKVEGGRIVNATLIKGDENKIREHQHKLKTDPVTGELGELGFGTQVLPVSGRDIQDEKILGTFHVATGRSDHLGGHLTPDKFKIAKNATHDDILFAPHKTPEINVPQVRMFRDGKMTLILENYKTSDFLQSLMN